MARFPARGAIVLSLLSLVAARISAIPGLPKVYVDTAAEVVSSLTGATLPPYNTVYHFNQLIDHNDPSKGTFVQRYWHTWEFYQPGGPIILSTPGEANAAGYYGYLTNRTMNGLIAQQENGATIVLEHRFYGLSNPYPDLSVQSLQGLHTLQQAIDDLVYFAQNVVLPMPGGDSVTPDVAPWILIGGSYAGALTAWTMVNKPGIFWAGYASSAVVEAITDFWRYFEPIYEYMPRNCSSDVQAVIELVDKTFSSNVQTDINYIKGLFGMSTLTHLDDVAGALRYNLWDWQSMQPFSGPGATFYNFCDALEVKNGTSASAEGWGVSYALSAWGNFFSGNYTTQLCGGYTIEECLGSYDANSSMYTNTTIDNAFRSWYWIVCNEVGFFQDGAPIDQPTIVTRLVQPSYDERQCQWMFPQAFATPPTPNVMATNSKYKGWSVNVDRLFFATAQRDPWREATMAATTQNLRSTASQPIAVSDGFHCSDLITRSGVVDATVANVQMEALQYFSEWMASWHASAHGQS